MPSLTTYHRLAALGMMLLLLSCSVQAAESFSSRLKKAQASLERGDVDSAITQYRELQTEDPESDVLYYDMGCAQYQRAMQEVDLNAAVDAVASLEEAKASFDKVTNSSNAQIRANAKYNHANTLAKIAEHSLTLPEAGSEEQRTGIEETFRQAIDEYESILKKDPGHEGARQNLDYVRYVLKQMLQNPPPPPEQQQGGENQEGDEQEKKEDQEQQQQEGDQQQQQNQQEQEQQQGEDEQEEKEQQEQQDEQEQQQQQQQEQQQQQQEQQQGEQPEDDTEPPDMQNVEAILESLEDMDHREQKETKNQRAEIRMDREWW